MSDLTHIESLVGPLVAGRKARHLLTDDGLGYQMTGHDVRLVLNALAEAYAVIERLVGENKELQAALAHSQDQRIVITDQFNGQAWRAEQAEAAAGARYEENVVLKHNLDLAEADLREISATLGHPDDSPLRLARVRMEELAEQDADLAAMTKERDHWKMLFHGACGNEDDAEERADGRLRTIKELRADLAAAREEAKRLLGLYYRTDDARAAARVGELEAMSILEDTDKRWYEAQSDLKQCTKDLAAMTAERDELLAATDDLRAFLHDGDHVKVSTPGKAGSITFTMGRLARYQLKRDAK